MVVVSVKNIAFYNFIFLLQIILLVVIIIIVTVSRNGRLFCIVMDITEE